MRKLLGLTLALLLLVSLIACGDDQEPASSTATPSGEDSTPSASTTIAGDPTVSASTTATSADTITDTTTLPNGDNTTTTKTNKPTATTTTKDNSPGLSSGTFEKPVTANTAGCFNKRSSAYDTQAETMRRSILKEKDTVKAANGGKTYYVSYRGNNKNNGMTANTPWLDITNLLDSSFLSAGDVILFERGGVYRDVALFVPNGVSVGAYGTGEKPQLLGSDKNYADPKLWKETSTKNVWSVVLPAFNGATRARASIEDYGNIIFNHGETVASPGKKLSLKAVKADFDFFYDADKNTLYLYHSKGNPGSSYKNIDMAPNEHVVRLGGTDHVIENLCVKYGGAHGISAGTSKNITIRGCEIGWIGGGMLTKTCRFGNGIEFFGKVDNCLVEDNWIYQCFDAGYTNQTTAQGAYEKNITVQDNLIEYCNYNIELWTYQEVGKGGMENCQYINNILRFAGFGFGTVGRIGSNSSAVGNISLFDYVVPCKNVLIQGNIIDCSYRYLVYAVYPNDTEGRGPTITGNTWNQQTFSNSDTTATVGRSFLETSRALNCATQAEMETSVKKLDKEPVKITLEK